ncbi:hypothetical protein ABT336_13305 [Micromonospora sp. NPDC000207]|uniref:hypothetical protein n=1 Tax=Micromonospora sp. NPDC000207 TaxID=3154246 RepID=UPI00332D9FC5
MSTASTRKPRAAAPRSAPAKATDTKPAPVAEDVALNLDDLEREGAVKPFTFLHQGRVYTIPDPQEMDWQKQLRAMGDPVYFLQHSLSPEDAEAFFNAEMPSWKLDAVMSGFQKHFGLPSLGELNGSLT